ncbi:hypothetical protein BaRGS_00032887 [Batillaria attramentaria]|uniref:Uncharacterized protein n=1 Tax=Batillaria attramentaria TaxID=370345 RepID=A0ABD0JLF9_9CAEN
MHVRVVSPVQRSARAACSVTCIVTEGVGSPQGAARATSPPRKQYGLQQQDIATSGTREYRFLYGSVGESDADV